MTSFINTNPGSINSQRHLNTSQASLSTSLERLSSGLRINNARDDAAGMSIAERFTSQIKGVNQAGRNANDGISMTQVAEGSLATTADALQRVRELAVQAANATNTAGDRKSIQDEVNQLLTEMDRTAQTTQFNGMNLMDGSASNMAFQVGANSNQTVSVTNGNFRTNAYGDYRMGSLAATSTTSAGDLTMGSTPLTSVSTASAAAGGNRFGIGTFTVVGSTGNSLISTTATSSAKSIAASINAVTSKTNVTASATTAVNATFAAGTYSFLVQSNNPTGQEKTVAFTVGTDTTNVSDAIGAFNSVSSSTGVTAKASDDGTGLTLTNASGENIVLTANISNNAVATIGAQAIGGGGAADVTTINGELTLDSSKSFGVTGITGTTVFTAAAAVAGTSMAVLQSVNTIDVSSVASATRAISQVDGALAAIDAQRGLYGAMQSRFANAVSNLQSASENMSASRSRIQDTDFASETASLTRGQILQQAGTAMLAQANSLPNGVLALLRG